LPQVVQTYASQIAPVAEWKSGSAPGLVVTAINANFSLPEVPELQADAPQFSHADLGG
jgi:hypothetical protein